MRILICDDDLEMSMQLKEILQCFFSTSSLNIPEITIYNNGTDLLLDFGEKDIVFLDIELPDVSGIYVGNELKKTNSNTIIFIVTSYSQYLDDAMRFHVFRYLSKPLDKQRIFRNMKDAINLYTSSVTKIPIETKTEVFTVLTSDIVCIEAQGRKITIHTTTGDYDSIHNMHYWTDTLNMPCFFTSHRSFIVNLRYVSNFDHSLIYLYGNKIRAYLTKRKYTQFKDAYMLYLESTR